MENDRRMQNRNNVTPPQNDETRYPRQNDEMRYSRQNDEMRYSRQNDEMRYPRQNDEMRHSRQNDETRYPRQNENFDLEEFYSKYRDIIPQRNGRSDSREETNSRDRCRNDFGGRFYVVNMNIAANRNRNFRTAIWTGSHMQCTLMSIARGEDIGTEVHPDTDQCIRVESGRGVVSVGNSRERLENSQIVSTGDTIFIPAGVWHNIENAGTQPLKLSSMYAPPNHPRCTLQGTKENEY